MMLRGSLTSDKNKWDRSCWKVPGAHTLLMSEVDERFHRKNKYVYIHVYLQQLEFWILSVYKVECVFSLPLSEPKVDFNRLHAPTRGLREALLTPTATHAIPAARQGDHEYATHPLRTNLLHAQLKYELPISSWNLTGPARCVRYRTAVVLL